MVLNQVVNSTTKFTANTTFHEFNEMIGPEVCSHVAEGKRRRLSRQVSMTLVDLTSRR